MLSIQDIEHKEKELNEKIDAYKNEQYNYFKINYIEKKLNSHPDDSVRKITLALVCEKHALSKIHSRFGSIKTDFDRLDVLVPQALHNWKDALILCQIKECQQQMQNNPNADECADLLRQLKELFDLRKELASYLGDRVVNPKN